MPVQHTTSFLLFSKLVSQNEKEYLLFSIKVSWPSGLAQSLSDH